MTSPQRLATAFPGTWEGDPPSATAQALSAHCWAGPFRLTADTAPGAPGPLAALPTCTSPHAYRAAIRWRYTNCPASRQQLWVLARHLNGDGHRAPLNLSGPFAAEARAILNQMREQAGQGG
ncbi:hypothetical protein [Thiobaca trueperi]|uniref:Uncharacterized protein n=1 Tax=Thiobaca trueperi TaxID=127458 RepID=A0A4R3MXZ1_9GAMM|nr:hypothetical protein [Thiobaca trueperi]TCT21215.1 hypothetical protein EDC35_10468 [Thiobaca trueperi]